MKLLFLLGITLSLFAAPPWLDAPKSFEQFEKLLAGNGRTSDLFGYSVAISGDTAVVGSYFHEEGSALNTGAAYIFTFDAQSGTFVQQAMLSASDFRDGDSFGFSVAISGDTVVVGSYRHGPVITRAGAAYVFVITSYSIHYTKLYDGLRLRSLPNPWMSPLSPSGVLPS